ncbi:hypothetical protein [Clostridium phage A2]|nr:hypothetical protein [Clostridium phage A2]WAB24156.1 hypothetical protein [Clostridium phage C2]WAB24233.1 hypothetical protein [Clostridium phage H1]WAB24310.1 hypothetical protein [Clostridium phage D1]WAB24387.1 hypothetical protein [Clostridium phage E1]
MSYMRKERYKHSDLNNKVNRKETLKQFIRNTEKEFDLEPANLGDMTRNELNNYINYMDELWSK